MADSPKHPISPFFVLLFALLIVPFGNALNLPRATSDYAPQPADCPSAPLVRPAQGLSQEETAFVAARKPQVDAALAKWLQNTDPSFDTSSLPTLALAISGGGFRAHLIGAGITQALDERDSFSGVAGLWQAMMYQTALSGGSWMLASMIGNGWATISSIQDNLWRETLNSGLWFAQNSMSNPTFVNIAADVKAKANAGFKVVVTDVWGRLLSDMLLYGKDGGVSDTMTGLADLDTIKQGNAPLPILTTRGVDISTGACRPTVNATQYEHSPFEFGSWDEGVEAFVTSRYMGSKISNGVGQSCFTGYDNLGWALGASSSQFNQVGCYANAILQNSGIPQLVRDLLKPIISAADDASNAIGFAYLPNPFQGYSGSPLVAGKEGLTLVDGGQATNVGEGQCDPIWPLIHPARSVDVIFVNDNSADVNNFPDSNALYQSFLQAQAQGLGDRVPSMPTPDEYNAKGMGSQPTFFGCHSQTAATIVYLPNYNYTYPSNVPSGLLSVKPDMSDGLIADGAAVAAKGGDPQWPLCLACGIMAKKPGAKPAGCDACLQQYCYS